MLWAYLELQDTYLRQHPQRSLASREGNVQNESTKTRLPANMCQAPLTAPPVNIGTERSEVLSTKTSTPCNLLSSQRERLFESIPWSVTRKPVFRLKNIVLDSMSLADGEPQTSTHPTNKKKKKNRLIFRYRLLYARYNYRAL